MAAIDKTYVRTWEEYCEIVEWCKTASFTCPNGTVIKFYCCEWNENSFKNLEENRSLPVLNTSHTQDYFLMKYCPIKVVQDRIRDVYSDEYIESVLNGTSKWDTFVRPDKISKLKVIQEPKRKSGCKYYNKFYKRKVKDIYCVSISLPEEYGNYPWYDDDDSQQWVLPYELGNVGASHAIFRVKSYKALIRKIMSWHLPKGTIIEAEFLRHYGGECKFIVK